MNSERHYTLVLRLDEREWRSSNTSASVGSKSEGISLVNRLRRGRHTNESGRKERFPVKSEVVACRRQCELARFKIGFSFMNGMIDC